MDDLTRYLYEFVRENCMGSVHQDPEYGQAARNVELQTEKVGNGMSETKLRELQTLLNDMTALFCIESEYLFQVTLGLARELDKAAGGV